MTPYTLEEAVEPGDLIMVWAPGKAEMLLVKSTGSEATSAASSVTAKIIPRHIPIEEGYWTLDGPVINYWEVDESKKGEDKDKNKDDDDDPSNYQETNLDFFLQQYKPTDTEMKVFVHPHGRDVLQYYFGDECPECCGDPIICPGCGGVSMRYPEHFGCCSLKIACPHCMGYDFSLDDKEMNQYQQELADPIFNIKDAVPSSEEDLERLNEDLDSATEEYIDHKRYRHELVNSRRNEMGYPIYNLDKMTEGMREGMDEIKEALPKKLDGTK